MVNYSHVRYNICSSVCVDTPNWTNDNGYNCQNYAENGWCANGAFADEYKWTGSPDQGSGSSCEGHLTDEHTNCAMVYNYPADNCCECGKSGTSLKCNYLYDRSNI